MNLSAVLLVGGESRRMGRDKARLVFEGEALWKRQLRLLQTQRPQEIFFAARQSETWHPGDVTGLFDEPPSCGPLSGLTNALREMRTTHLLALAVDMPFVNVELLEIFSRQLSAGVGVVALSKKRAEPLCAVYPKEALPFFSDALASKNFSLQPLVQTLIRAQLLRSFPLQPEQEEFFGNLNEPHDLSRAREDSNLRPTD